MAQAVEMCLLRLAVSWVRTPGLGRDVPWRDEPVMSRVVERSWLVAARPNCGRS